jgi:hypothetical protein
MALVNRGRCASAVRASLAFTAIALATSARAGSAPVISPLVMVGDEIPDVGHVMTIDDIAINNSGAWLALVSTNASSGASVLLRNGVAMLRETSGVAPDPAAVSSFGSLMLCDTGEAACHLFLSGTGGSASDSGIYLASAAAPFVPGLVWQESHFAPGLSPGTRFIGFAKADVNDNRQMLIVCSVDDPAIASASDRAIYRVQLNAAGQVTGSTLIAIENQVLPGQSEPAADFGVGPHNSAINDSGDVMFVADLTPTTATDGVVYLNSTVIAQEGSPSPVPGRDWLALSTQVRMDLNSSGGWVHSGTLAGDQSTSLVIVSNNGKVIQEGDGLPAIGAGLVFTAFGSGPIEIDDASNVLWFGDWNDNSSRDTGLFLNHELLIQEGVTTIDGVLIDEINSEADGYHISDNGRHIIAELTLANGVSGAFMISFPADCPADVNGSGAVDVDDLIAVILNWGCTAPAQCQGDANGSGGVDVDDLIAVILAWGVCP